MQNAQSVFSITSLSIETILHPKSLREIDFLNI